MYLRSANKPVSGAGTPNVVAADAPVPGAAAPDVVAPEAPDVMAPEAPATAAVAPSPGAVMASTAGEGAATASTPAAEVPTLVPEVPTPSSEPVAEEELEVVSGRRLLQGPPEVEAAPLPQVLVRVRQSIEEATSTAKAAFRREWAALESERQRLGDWHSRLEALTKAKASLAARVRSELKADQEAYRANLRKVFDREFAVSSREKALAQREETFAQEVASLAAQRSDLEIRLAAQRSEL